MTTINFCVRNQNNCLICFIYMYLCVYGISCSGTSCLYPRTTCMHMRYDVKKQNTLGCDIHGKHACTMYIGYDVQKQHGCDMLLRTNIHMHWVWCIYIEYNIQNKITQEWIQNQHTGYVRFAISSYFRTNIHTCDLMLKPISLELAKWQLRNLPSLEMIFLSGRLAVEMMTFICFIWFQNKFTCQSHKKE